LLFLCFFLQGFALDIVGKFGYFFPGSKVARKVYGHGFPSYQLELTMLSSRDLNWWNNFSYSSKCGKSTELKVPTSLEIYSIQTGIKYSRYFNHNIIFSMGIGPIYSWLTEKNNSNFVPNKTKEKGLGGIIKFNLTKDVSHFLFSINLDYQFQRFNSTTFSQNININLDGLFLGIGFGYKF
jgi:hypothetical protein